MEARRPRSSRRTVIAENLCIEKTDASRARRSPRAAVLAMTVLISASCAVRRAPDPAAGASACVMDQSDTATLRWQLRTPAHERAALDAWCAAVGPPVFVARPAAAGDAILDSITVIAWNARGGDGDLDALLRDLRDGRITGAPVEHFVVLLQEVVRSGPDVPAAPPAWAAIARRAGAADLSLRFDVERFADRHGLALLYAPSMRNGDHTVPAAEDKGNAILSTLPLREPTLLELPFERQRRVAVVATIEATASNGEPWTLRFASAHLDNRTRAAHLYRSFGAGRTHQARALADALAGGPPTAVGADLNTWFSGREAGATRLLRTAFPDPPVLPAERTLPLPGPLPDLRLDYLLFRLPDAWDARYRVVDATYGSDHRPLVGSVAISVVSPDSAR
jgi:endonuclease/exonuclease/phosphatase family metal-dependent hydrolase